MRGRRVFTILFALMFFCSLIIAGDAKEKEFAGRVTGIDSKAVAGAKVALYRVEVAQEKGSFEGEKLAEMESDEEGRFTFSIVDDGDKGYKVFCCLAEKEGFSCGWSTSERNDGQDYSISLTEPNGISGFVYDSNDVPIGDAEVRLVFLNREENKSNAIVGADLFEDFVSKTGSDGGFKFENLPDDCGAEILVKKAGYGGFTSLTSHFDYNSALSYKAGQRDIKINMAKACKISGVVVDKSQKPIGGVSVRLIDARFPAVNFFNVPTKSDDEGKFEFVDLSSGKYLLKILSDDYIADFLKVEVEGDTSAKLEAVRGGELEVKVVDADTSEIIAGANVSMKLESSGGSSWARVNEKGVLNKRLKAGNYKINAHDRKYKSSESSVDVEIKDGEKSSIVVKLKGAGKLTGTVVGPDGKGLEGVDVMVLPSGSHEKVKSDSDGRFELIWNPKQITWTEGEFYVLAINGDKKLSGTLRVSADSKDVKVELEPSVTARGRVVDVNDKPIDGSKILVYFSGSRWSSSVDELKVNMKDGGGYEAVNLFANSKFYLSVCGPKGYGRENINFTTGNASDGEVELETVKLQLADQIISGVTVDSDGKVIGEVNLHCYGNGQPNLNVKSDKDGKFVFENVCKGEIRLSANFRKDGKYLNGYVMTEGGATDLKIVVCENSSYGGYKPKKPVSQVGKKLFDLKEFGVEVPLDAKGLLVFFWDKDQRPSRHFLEKLVGKGEFLKSKGIIVVLLHANKAEGVADWLKEKNISFLSGVISEDCEKKKFDLGVQSLPWAVLTDAGHKIVAEGFLVTKVGKVLKGL